VWAVGPFVGLLLAIAVGPLVPGCAKFWQSNRNKLIVALALAVPVLVYYGMVHPAMTVKTGPWCATGLEAGWPVLGHVLAKAVLEEYVPFIVLLLALYVIRGGIRLRGDLPAHPGTNTAFLAVGGVPASLIGTTGAAMLLIRPLLATNSERRHVRHTVIFFIFIANPPPPGPQPRPRRQIKFPISLSVREVSVSPVPIRTSTFDVQCSMFDVILFLSSSPRCSRYASSTTFSFSVLASSVTASFTSP